MFRLNQEKTPTDRRGTVGVFVCASGFRARDRKPKETIRKFEPPTPGLEDGELNRNGKFFIECAYVVEGIFTGDEIIVGGATSGD